MQKLGIREEDLVESFIKGSGKGGQKINKSNHCVRLRHPPSDIEVRVQRSRSLQDNRYFARRLLCEKLEEKTLKKKSEKQQKIEKIKRQKRKRSKRAKEKVLHDKKMNSLKKQRRNAPLKSGD